MQAVSHKEGRWLTIGGKQHKLVVDRYGTPRLDDGRIYAYRAIFPKDWSALQIELCAFRENFTPERNGEHSGKDQHFWNIAKLILGPDSPLEFIRHPWAEEMAYYAARHKYLALTGCASSGKSEFMGAWGLAHFWAAPYDTLVLLTSTTIREARKRIWASVTRWFNAGSLQGMPGKITQTPTPMIKMPDATDAESISVIPGEKGKEKETVGKMIGMKSAFILVMGDELSELSPALLEGARTNLVSAPMWFQFIGSSNAKSYLDPFGILAEPAAGWESIDVNTGRWPTKIGGYALHFDGEKSPNLGLPEDKYPIYGHRLFDEHQKLGSNSPGYWRQARGFWCPAGAESTIYNEGEIIRCGGMETADQVDWVPGSTIRLSALDPAHTAHGDRSAVIMATAGLAKPKDTPFDAPGRFTIVVDAPQLISIDVSNRNEEQNFQIVRKWKQLCEREGVTPYNAAFDSTNIPFADIVSSQWSREVLRVNFGGSASDRRTSDQTARPANESYINRMSELWFGGVEFLRNRQLKGLTKELIDEMVERTYDYVKRGENFLHRVETKDMFKRRLGKSPDLADALFVLIELARTRMGFRLRAGSIGQQTDWMKAVQHLDVVSGSPAVEGFNWNA